MYPQVFLGFVDDVLDVPWRVKLARTRPAPETLYPQCGP